MRLELLFILVVALMFNSACNQQSQASDATNLVNNSISESQDNAVLINLNSATVKDLETLPGIGPGLAARIVEYREVNGKFKKPEHLMLVQGISDKRFRKIRSMITAS